MFSELHYCQVVKNETGAGICGYKYEFEKN